MKYYVYEYWDPKNNEPFYVGAGQDNRMYDHLTEAKHYNKIKERKGLNHFKIRKILKIWNQDLEPNVIVVFRTDDIDEVYNKEIELIRYYGRRDLGLGPLTNLTDGGEGLVNRSPETIRKNIESAMKTKSEWSLEKRRELSEIYSNAQKERWNNLSEEEKENQTKHIGEWWESLSKEEREKRLEKNVENLKTWREDNPKEVLEAQRKSKEAINNMSKEEKEQHSTNVSLGMEEFWALLSEKERKDRGQKISETRANWTDEKKSEYSKNMSKTKKEFFEKETLEKKEERIEKHKDSWKNVDKIEFGRKMSNIQKNKTEAEKQIYSKNMSKFIKNMWNNMSDEEKILRSNKTRLTRLSKRLDKVREEIFNGEIVV